MRGDCVYKSCNICGRIHRVGERCPQKKYRKREGRDEDAFRSTSAWQKKREQIKQRDLYLCRVCLAEKGAQTREGFCFGGLSVHHIEPLGEAWERRLDDDNLITLCGYHHELAENGRVSRARLHELAGADVFDKE